MCSALYAALYDVVQGKSWAKRKKYNVNLKSCTVFMYLLVPMMAHHGNLRPHPPPLARVMCSLGFHCYNLHVEGDGGGEIRLGGRDLQDRGGALDQPTLPHKADYFHHGGTRGVLRLSFLFFCVRHIFFSCQRACG